MWIVVTPFVDLQDNDYRYAVGEKYPRKGKRATKKRIAELSSTGNRRRMVLIKEVKEEK